MEDDDFLNGVLKIAPIRASISNGILEGKGAMSSYCTISLKEMKHITQIDHYSGDEPEWSDTIMTIIDSATSDEVIEIKVFHNDDFSPHSLIGACSIKLESVLHTAEK